VKITAIILFHVYLTSTMSAMPAACRHSHLLLCNWTWSLIRRR